MVPSSCSISRDDPGISCPITGPVLFDDAFLEAHEFMDDPAFWLYR
jgi:hypothetical protein